jgi:hypothetical protein
MYKLCKNLDGTPANCVIRITDNASIPMDKANTDYQAYLKWVAEGNTPQEAE